MDSEAGHANRDQYLPSIGHTFRQAASEIIAFGNHKYQYILMVGGSEPTLKVSAPAWERACEEVICPPYYV